MSTCLEIFCCCFYPTTPSSRSNNRQQSHNTRNHSSAKKKKRPKKSRIITKFTHEDIVKVTKQEKKSGKLAYTCPICTELYNKILACEECNNNVCHVCCEDYERKYLTEVENMKCPFCLSQKAQFIDYEKQAHSYFDTTENGFLGASMRKKIDEELGMNKDQHNNSSIIKQKESMERLQMHHNENQDSENLQPQREEGRFDLNSNGSNRLEVIQQEERNTIMMSNQNIENVDQYQEIVVSRPAIDSINMIGQRQSRYLERNQEIDNQDAERSPSQQKREDQNFQQLPRQEGGGNLEENGQFKLHPNQQQQIKPEYNSQQVDQNEQPIRQSQAAEDNKKEPANTSMIIQIEDV